MENCMVKSSPFIITSVAERDSQTKTFSCESLAPRDYNIPTPLVGGGAGLSLAREAKPLLIGV